MINTKKEKREFLMFILERPLNKILDLGCGRGFMSKFFHKKTTKIRGIDIREMSENSENFKFILGDIRKEDFEKENDLIMASLILHVFENQVALKLIEKMKQSTSNGGYNFLICMTNEDDLAKTKRGKFYPSLNEIKEIYSDWHLIKKVQGRTEMEDHNNLGPHNHDLMFLLFQKRSL